MRNDYLYGYPDQGKLLPLEPARLAALADIIAHYPLDEGEAGPFVDRQNARNLKINGSVAEAVGIAGRRCFRVTGITGGFANLVNAGDNAAFGLDTIAILGWVRVMEPGSAYIVDYMTDPYGGIPADRYGWTLRMGSYATPVVAGGVQMQNHMTSGALPTIYSKLGPVLGKFSMFFYSQEYRPGTLDTEYQLILDGLPAWDGVWPVSAGQADPGANSKLAIGATPGGNLSGVIDYQDLCFFSTIPTLAQIQAEARRVGALRA